MAAQSDGKSYPLKPLPNHRSVLPDRSLFICTRTERRNRMGSKTTLSRRQLLTTGGVLLAGGLLLPTHAFATKGGTPHDDPLAPPRIRGELLDKEGAVVATTEERINPAARQKNTRFTLASTANVRGNQDGTFTAMGEVELLDSKSTSTRGTDHAGSENGAARATIYITYSIERSSVSSSMGRIKISQAKGVITKLNSSTTLGTRALAAAQGLDYRVGEVFGGMSHTINTGWPWDQYWASNQAPYFAVNGGECTAETTISGMGTLLLRAELFI